MDRAGYGDSSPATPVANVAAHASAIAPLLGPDCIVVGYSYGAPVALRLALDHPDLVSGLVLISCPIDPALEHVHPFQRLAATPIAARFLPQGLHSSNMELLPLRADLESLVAQLGQITAKVTLIHGMRDTLVPPSNMSYLAQRLTRRAAPRCILLPDGDHYLPWTYRQTLEDAISYVLRDCAVSPLG